MLHPGDEPRPAAEGQVRPGPVEQHQQPVAEADQEEDVDEQPGQPGEEARAASAARTVAHRRAAADDGEAALVEVAERPRRLAAQRAADVRPPCAGPPASPRGDTPGTGLPSCSSAARSPMTKTSSVPGDGQVGLDQHPARAVERHAQRAGQRRGRHPRRPDHRARRQALAAQVHARRRRCRSRDRPVRTSTPSRSSCRWRLRRQLLGVARQHARQALDQDHPRSGWGRCGGSRRAGCGGRSRPAPRPARRRWGRRRRSRRSSTPLRAPGSVLALGRLEGQEHAPADLQRVLDALQARARTRAQSSWPK